MKHGIIVYGGVEYVIMGYGLLDHGIMIFE